MAEDSLSRKERERKQHENDILESALALFAEKGYENVSVSEIAEKAEFGTGTLYNFFESKELLFREIVRKYLDAAQQCLKQALDSDTDIISRLKAFAVAKGEFVRDNLKFVRVYMHDLRNPSLVSLQKEIIPAIENIHLRLEVLFRQGIEKGIFKKHDPYILAVSFNGLSSIFIFNTIHFPEKFDYFENADTLMEIFFENVLVDNNSKQTN